MKSRDNDDKQITDSLKKMPGIKNNWDKDELYRKISSRLNENTGRQTSRNGKLIPLFSVLMVLAIVLISVPILLEKNHLSTNSLHEQSHPEISVSDKQQGAANNQSGKQESASTTQHQANTLRKDKAFQSHVITSTTDSETIVRGAIADKQAQFIIPVTFIFPETISADQRYQLMDDYLTGKLVKAGTYMLHDATFQVNPSKSTVVLNMPDSFSIQSSTEANMFTRTIQTMFGTNGIEKAVFTQKISLGPIGTVKELKVSQERKAAYKLYKPGHSGRSFLVPVTLDKGNGIKSAINKMKQNRKKFNIYSTIPDVVEVSVQGNNRVLEVTFSGDLKQNQENLTMIEAILMTAGSYGFEQVQFQNTGIQLLGVYNLSEPINVPTGANPVKIKHSVR
ncbi:hypothetical protein [Virgibacillus siamensis]|uniref:hypothetical protein n=1 Tax=Virgibacillus siamensis TaxID=480071 RepID=UPI000984D647|nr:hypothetical protein [Virgibacillus siamensis]